MNYLLPFAPGVCLIVALTTMFWFPSLAAHLTVIHGDIAAIDMPIADLFARMVKGETSPLWSDSIYGGHPLFAEGQGGFAHPMNFIWAAVIAPLVGTIDSVNLHYFALMIIGGVGMIGFCRSLGISVWASAFAAVAVIFSPIWEFELYVSSAFGTLAWIPWSLWAFEKFVNTPTLKTASVFGAAFALVCLCGYYQGLHGAILYAFATLSVVPFVQDSRQKWIARWRSRITLTLIACAIGIGLASIQLIPLVELVGLSHRREGIPIPVAGLTPATSYIRGLLSTSYTNNTSVYFPGVGSLFICILASSSLILPVRARVIGHVVGSFVLFQLGMERASPIFRIIYDYDLLPGLHYFRSMQFYMAIAAIGIAVVAASAIDALARYVARSHTDPEMALRAMSGNRKMAFVFLTLAWIGILVIVGVTRYIAAHSITIFIAGLVLMGLVQFNKPTLLAPAFALVLTAECLGGRLHPFNFFDKSVLASSPAIAAIQSVPNWREFKMTTVSWAGLAGLIRARSKHLEAGMRKMISTISPMTNLSADLPSMVGHLALPLQRRMAIEELLRDEMLGRVTTRPGLRLIDFLAIRFITSEEGHVPFAKETLDNTPGFEIFHVNKTDGVWTMENKAALPRFQLYTHHRTAKSFEEALSKIRSLRDKTLIIEALDDVPEIKAFGQNHVDSTVDSQPADYKLETSTSTEYRLSVSAQRPVWLFLADANYPGWKATIDGQNAPVFTAQILGKAVLIPPGVHKVAITFKSMSFCWGLGITILTCGVLAFILITK